MRSKLLLSLALTFSFLFPSLVNAQNTQVKGTVKDENNEPVGFATVQLSGTNFGSISDIEGNYLIQNVPSGDYKLNVTMIGYKKFELPISLGTVPLIQDIVLKKDVANLNEVVVVGYGTKVKKDLTGSVTSVGTKEFNSGSATSPEQLIIGKVAGVQITSNGGAPGSGSRIRIRGGSSLNASNDPLIVIDGIPIENTTISGSPNALSLISSNEIENITVLKDASAAAIYGSRASNGVILVTTKKGQAGKLKVEFTSVNSISTVVKKYDLLSGDEFRKLVTDSGSATQKALLGKGNTNWLDEILRNSISSDNNVGISGGVKNIPYRLSIGRLDQSGVIITSNMQRNSVGLNVNPSFFDKKLKIDVTTKYTNSKFRFSDEGAVGSAISFDPTQSVHSDTSLYNGYFEWLDASGKPNYLARRNPLGLLYDKKDISDVNRFIGNLGIDYSLPFVKNLRAHVNLGTDVVRSSGTVFIPETAASAYLQKGSSTQYKQDKDNKLLEMYAVYSKVLPKLQSRADITFGHSYQDFITSSPSFAELNAIGDTITKAGIPSKTQNTLLSFYGRLNYDWKEKYLFTFTLRDDGSSRFSPDVRWGLFPSAAFAWRVSDESFLKNVKILSDLKVRVGYGITGQQDIISNDYPYIANYSQGELTAQYQFGNTFYYTLRPDGYDVNIKWEETSTLNAGLDFGFYNGRINGSIDVYKKETTDLLAVIPVPAGTNFTNNLLTNVGSLTNQGVEVSLNFIPVAKKNLTWEVGINMTVNKSEITKLNRVQSQSDVGVLVGGIGGGTGNTIQVNSVGFSPYSFYVYNQLYAVDGRPLEGKYADLNGDGKITPDDRYRYQSPEPKISLGFNSSVNYKNWSAGFSMRAQFNNYVYNNVNSQLGTFAYVDGSKKYLNNISSAYYDSHFKLVSAVATELLSDYYIEKASFLRMDNISFGYQFKKVFKKDINVKASLGVQNAFIVTNYKGLDPEIAGGIDNFAYPRPRVYSLTLNFQL